MFHVRVAVWKRTVDTVIRRCTCPAIARLRAWGDLNFMYEEGKLWLLQCSTWNSLWMCPSGGADYRHLTVKSAVCNLPCTAMHGTRTWRLNHRSPFDRHSYSAGRLMSRPHSAFQWNINVIPTSYRISNGHLPKGSLTKFCTHLFIPHPSYMSGPLYPHRFHYSNYSGFSLY